VVIKLKGYEYKQTA